MDKKQKILMYYENARELVRQKKPKAARKYLLVILNDAFESYKSATTIFEKAKMAAFMKKWLAVSSDLYDFGVTDYVLECFGLIVPQQKKTAPKETFDLKPILPKIDADGKSPSADSGEIDISGLIDDAAKTQGWCADVFEKNEMAVVEISASSSSKNVSGTGFIISKNGYLLTNDHVVFDKDEGAYCSKISMSFIGQKKSYNVEILFSDRKSDVALCKFDPNEVGTFSAVKRVANYAEIKPGADCVVMGNAFGLGIAPFMGIVRFTKDKDGNMVYTAPSNSGDSGGPVFNRKGECIGINKSRTVAFGGEDAEAYTNATPMDKIEELLTKWTSNNKNIQL